MYYFVNIWLASVYRQLYFDLLKANSRLFDIEVCVKAVSGTIVAD